MEKIKFFNLLLLSCAITFLLATASFAANPYVLFVHRTDSNMNDGRSTYNEAEFSWLYIGVRGVDAKNKGTFTIKDGSYTFGDWDQRWSKENPGTEVAGTERQFDMQYVKNGIRGSGHSPLNSEGKELIFWGKADSGFSEKTLAYQLGNVKRELALPKIYSTREQLSRHVPCIEYVITGDKITGLLVRIVKPDDPATAIKKDDTVNVEAFTSVYLFGRRPRWDLMFAYDKTREFKNGDTLQIEVKVDPPIETRFIGVAEVNYRPPQKSKDTDIRYRWNFYQAH